MREGTDLSCQEEHMWWAPSSLCSISMEASTSWGAALSLGPVTKRMNFYTEHWAMRTLAMGRCPRQLQLSHSAPHPCQLFHFLLSRAMASTGSREQFLRQMEQIVEGIKQNRMKMEKKKQENKMRRDQLNDEYLELLEKQRLYFKTVKEFKEECRKNEMLLSKLKASSSWRTPAGETDRRLFSPLNLFCEVTVITAM